MRLDLKQKKHFLIFKPHSGPVFEGLKSVAPKQNPSPPAEIHFNGKVIKPVPPQKKQKYQKVIDLFSTILRKEIIPEECGILHENRYSDDYLKIPEFPVYIKPDVSDKELYLTHPNENPVVREFIWVSCLFGASFMGYEPDEKSHPLIDHNLNVDRYIKSVEVERDSHGVAQLHPYEIMMLGAFARLIPLMKTLGSSDVRVRYHLPDKDYMLYGIRLYIEGKFSYHALVQYISEVKTRANLHRKIIFAIAQKQNISITIESPFDNLWPGDIELSLPKLLKTLKLSKDQQKKLREEFPSFYRLFEDCDNSTSSNPNNSASTSPDSSDSYEEEDPVSRPSLSLDGYMELLREQRNDLVRSNHDTFQKDKEIKKLKDFIELYQTFFVENLLNKLAENSHSPIHQDTWKKIVDPWKETTKKPQTAKPKNLADLFKLANATFIAFATNQANRRNFEVCSFFPADEKPIAHHYSKKFSHDFGHTVSLFWLPFVLSYANVPNETTPHTNNLFRLRPPENGFQNKELMLVIQALLGIGTWFSDILESSLISPRNGSTHSNMGSMSIRARRPSASCPSSSMASSPEEEDENTLIISSRSASKTF